ncbi:hypothetical protein ACX93W_23055 [Paenibacillus sp. CAU 1782]
MAAIKAALYNKRPLAENKVLEVRVEDVEASEVVAEFVQRIFSYSQHIYNAKADDSILIVENLGYGDIYASAEGNAVIGEESQRILFGEQKAFKGGRLFLASASQPVAAIIEVR